MKMRLTPFVCPYTKTGGEHLVFFVKTFFHALCAIFELIFFKRLPRWRFCTAVAGIPTAGLVIVVIVADAITLKFKDTASGLRVLCVQTFALMAVLVLLGVPGLAAAVTAVPSTAAPVVVVIAILVTLVCW